MSRPRAVLAAAATRLARAGVASPDSDARQLLAHLLGIPLGRLPLVEEVPSSVLEEYDALVARRVAREPLQHLTGRAAFRHVELAVGPGVFVPRPETELLAGWAVDRVRELLEQGREPVAVDLCTGSGAVALALADEAPGARLHAAELDPAAYAWAERNLAGTGVALALGDLAEVFPELDGTVDVLTCNPPYVPLEAWESVAAEARDHDPHLALFSGADGLDAIRALEVRAARLLRPGGVLGFEHADVQGESAPGLFAGSGRWADVRDHRDLAGRPRYTTARLAR
jgi:release factor glutamine methyltransferase